VKIGLVSDAHGNALALAACLKKLESFQVDQVYFLGDAVGYFPGERAVLELLRSASISCQKGNHEAMLLGTMPVPSTNERVYQLEPARARLSVADRSFVESWPTERVVSAGGKHLLLVHGSPENHLQGYIYPDTDLSSFDALTYDAVFMGHTHYPFVAERQDMLIVNVGSCGLPRDQGNLAAFALYDTAAHSCDIFRLQMDINAIFDQFGTHPVADEVYQVLNRKSPKLPFGQYIGKGL
jgi:putative phosphoesterase